MILAILPSASRVSRFSTSRRSPMKASAGAVLPVTDFAFLLARDQILDTWRSINFTSKSVCSNSVNCMKETNSIVRRGSFSCANREGRRSRIPSAYPRIYSGVSVAIKYWSTNRSSNYFTFFDCRSMELGEKLPGGSRNHSSNAASESGCVLYNASSH